MSVSCFIESPVRSPDARLDYYPERQTSSRPPLACAMSTYEAPSLFHVEDHSIYVTRNAFQWPCRWV
ncbi:unnamed protein product [Protopolystoma xenopodis]|uniref:Uncharacterized protein n=1 Tax=Protopolystoma xenopodis TaxID=117903 RepID=A0A448XQI7_9PLAT|nr:unnamed protein product [Protopolystoma xenopodis]